MKPTIRTLTKEYLTLDPNMSRENIQKSLSETRGKRTILPICMYHDVKVALGIPSETHKKDKRGRPIGSKSKTSKIINFKDLISTLNKLDHALSSVNNAQKDFKFFRNLSMYQFRKYLNTRIPNK